MSGSLIDNSVTAQTVPVKTEGETRAAAFGFKNALPSTVTISATFALVEVNAPSTNPLTLGTVARNTGALTILGVVHAANEALEVDISAGSQEVVHELKATVTLSDGQILIRRFRLRVLED